MAGELDLSPPEVPELTFLENVLRYGLFLGAIFQIICIIAVIVPSSRLSESDAEHSEQRGVDQLRKPKGTIPQIKQKPKKEISLLLNFSLSHKANEAKCYGL